ncbi:MAG: LacI family DNA-binding transcriptional regulator [Bacteroidota bacterium]
MSYNKGKTTIYDVAARAGVAISTVSRVLNKSNDVSDATRDKVLRAISDLQFRPHRTAKILAQKQSDSLVIALPSFTTPYHNSVLKGVRSRIREEELDLILFDLGSEDPKAKLLDFLGRGAVEGLILVLHVDDELVEELVTLRAPVILLGEDYEQFDCYYWDEAAGAKKATTHLIEQGHTNIGLIMSQFDPDQVLETRASGYHAAMEAAGLKVNPKFIQHGTTEKHAGISEESGYEAMESLMAMDEDITAVLALSDAQAIGAWSAVRNAGRQVPEDVAVVGYGDIKTSRYIGLSSVDLKLQEIGHKATDVMINRLSNRVRQEPPQSTLIVPELQIRRSSLLKRG